MPRFFVTDEYISNGEVTITGEDAHHIARSLRMAVGEEITVCDMHGTEYACSLERIRDDECICSITESHKGESEPPHDITLFMAYPKGDKLEMIVQKAVELGAVKIVPFESSRCIKKPKAEKQDKQTARLSRIAEEAAKQCGRARLPSVLAPISFKEMLSQMSENELILFCYEGGGESLREVLAKEKKPKSIAVIIGCEGGFSIEEAELLKGAGARTVTLGKRILRCETAPLYVLSCLSYNYEL